MRIRLGIIIILSALFLIVMATLYPFNFQGRGGGLRDLLIVGRGISDERDVLNNIFLFIPLGFGLGRLLIAEMQRRWITSMGVSVLASFGLAYTIEVLQTHMPSRFSSIVDVLANTTGGILGFFFFLLWYGEARSARASKFVKKYLLLLSLVYMGMVVLVTFYFSFDNSFNNWDKNYTLLLGNEATGDRPWQGCIFRAYIANRALTQKEVSRLQSREGSVDSIASNLLVSYEFTGTGSYHGHFEHLPALAWRGMQPGGSQDIGGCLGPDHWLETTQPAVFLAEKISATSELTIGVTVKTDRATQTGPARIISLSADPTHRNFTLGQQGRDLHIRLRTPLTGLNGVEPQLVVRDVFATDNVVDIIVTYNRAVLSVYIDGILSPQYLRLSPDSISIKDAIQGKAFHLVSHKLFYYTMIFLPLGILIAFVTKRSRNGRLPKAASTIAITILLSLLVEVILAEVMSRDIHGENIILSALITVSALVFVNVCMKLAESEKGTEV